MKKILILSAATLVLSSCGIYNKYKPVSEVPEGLYGSETVASADTANFGNLSWREVFTDSYLQNLIDSALVRNTDMQTAHLRVKEAEASLLTSKLYYLPSLFLAPEGAVSSFDRGKATQTYSLPVTASWELDIFGKVTTAKRRAKAAYEQSKEYEQAVKTQLVSAVANTYYTLLMLDAQYEISVSTEAAWKESVRTARAMKKAGMMTEAGLAQTEATYYNICTAVLDLKEQINQTENSMALLLAETPHKIQRGKLENQQLLEDFSVGIPLQMLSNRPDVRSAEFSLAQAFYTTNAARAAFYPQITLSGSAGWTNSAGSAIINPGKLLASAIGSLTQPLFYRGTNIARLKAAKAQEEQAKLSFQQTLYNAGSEVSNALSLYQNTSKKAESRQMQVESAKKASEDTKELFNLGTSTYLEVLSAQQSYLSAQISQVSDCFDKMQAVVSLYQALGGGRED